MNNPDKTRKLCPNQEDPDCHALSQRIKWHPAKLEAMPSIQKVSGTYLGNKGLSTRNQMHIRNPARSLLRVTLGHEHQSLICQSHRLLSCHYPAQPVMTQPL